MVLGATVSGSQREFDIIIETGRSAQQFKNGTMTTKAQPVLITRGQQRGKDPTLVETQSVNRNMIGKSKPLIRITTSVHSVCIKAQNRNRIKYNLLLRRNQLF